MITEQDIQMMDDFSEDAADLLKGLLQRDVSKIVNQLL